MPVYTHGDACYTLVGGISFCRTKHPLHSRKASERQKPPFRAYIPNKQKQKRSQAVSLTLILAIVSVVVEIQHVVYQPFQILR